MQPYALNKDSSFFALPNSPPSSCFAPSTNESDEDDFDHGALLIELINHFLNAMKPINKEYTAQTRVPLHRDPPYSGPHHEIIHGMDIGKIVHGGKDEGINRQKPKECVSQLTR